MKAPQPLMPVIYSEAVHLFNMLYQVKSCPEFVVLDCALYPHLNGYRGQIKSFNLQNGQYIVAVNTTQFNLPSSPSSFVMQLCPQYMETLVMVEKFGITNSGTLQSKEILSLPNMFLSSDTTTLTITIKFYWKLFEIMRKRYVRPEKTTNNQSSNALRLELTKMDNEDILKDQQNSNDELEYSSLSCNFTLFNMPFQVFDQSLFKSSYDLYFFELDMNMGTSPIDDLLQRVFADKGTIDLNKTSFGTLILGQILDSNIINPCLKW
jgi:hypothetical protein